jgi:hypothetical protein
MALRFADSFDHYSTANITRKWTTHGAGGGAVSSSISPSNGRNGTSSLRVTHTGSNNNSALGPSITLDSRATWIVGFSMAISAAPIQTWVFAKWADAGITQVDFRLNTDGTISATRGGVLLGTTTFALSGPNTYYIELKVTVDPSAGVVVIKVNESTKLNLTGQNTRATTNSTANNFAIGKVISLGTNNPSITVDHDDLYICDTSGSVNNDFIGDVRVQAILPDGAGSTTQWTPNGAGSNYQCVDESDPNDDTDYVSSANAGDVDTYSFSNVTPTTGTVAGVQWLGCARKDDAGVRTIAPAIRSGGTNYFGGNQNIGTSYTYYLEVLETNPDTTGAWTISEVNAAEFGQKVIA